MQEMNIKEEIFNKMNYKEKIEIYRKIREKVRLNISIKYLKIENMNEASKSQIKDTIENLKKKAEMEKMRKEIIEKNNEQEDLIFYNKYKDLMQKNPEIFKLLKKEENNENKSLIRGKLKSDANVSFILMKNSNDSNIYKDEFKGISILKKKKRISKREKKNIIENQLLMIGREKELEKQRKSDKSEEESQYDDSIYFREINKEDNTSSLIKTNQFIRLFF